jgi:hypothetical protein
MDQPIPSYTKEDLDRIVARDYPLEVSAEVNAILSACTYGGIRVRMACLKLASGDIASLRKYVSDACTDYRDVLSWAEYPAYGSAYNRGEEATKKAIETDWQELQAWLHRK